MTVFDHYPYLGTSLLWLLFCLAAVAVSGGARRMAFLSAVLSMPSALASVVVVPDYWRPVRVAVFLAGPEDALFSFASGGIAWAVATARLPRPLESTLVPRQALARYFRHMALGSALTLLLLGAGLPVMPAIIVASVAVAAVVAARRPELWPLAAAGAGGFTVAYLAALLTVFALWPGFAGQWDGASLSGLRLLGIPLEELGWALAYGAAWPLLVADACQLRVAGPACRVPARFAAERASRGPRSGAG